MGFLNDLRDKVHANARAKGFHDTPRTFGDDCALLHSEVSEAFEEFRAHAHPAETYYTHENTRVEGFETPMGPGVRARLNKPMGVPSELADVLIRLLDTCGLYGIDIDKIVEEKTAYNAERSRLHGGKRI